MWASVVGNAAVAGIQAVLLGAGLVLVGMPGAVFLIEMTFVLGLLPLIRAFGVWVPVSIYPLAIGRPGKTVILFVFGSLVSVSDISLRPAIIQRSRAPDVAVIAVGIVGWIVPFGTLGLVIGPVVLGGAKDILEIHAQGRVPTTTD